MATIDVSASVYLHKPLKVLMRKLLKLQEKRALEYTAFEKGFKRYLENKDYIEYDNLAQKTTKTFQEISRSIREIEAVAKSKGQKTVSPPAATPTTAPATTETEIKYSKEANDSSVDEKSGDQRSTNTNTNTTNEAQTDTKTDERTPHKDAAPDSEFHAFAEQIREIQLIEKDKLTLTVIMHMSQKAYVVDKNEPYDPLYRESMIEHRQAMGRMHEKINDITTEIRYECY